jgi:putative endonuclease
MSDRNYSLYVVRCADDSLYTGITLDVARRLREHASGVRGAKYLRGKGPLHLVFEQPVGARASASRLEYRVKRLDRSQKEALISGRLSLAELTTDGDDETTQASGGSSS